ncbi:uncharacterized protein LOC135170055 [Diachasmimorpha longicaudata]|uniref:uncharacterized protein LOC135170055 n=1 Tax=Diachasmimorpha longicaudata TaxID=58733 RepID=UPI0030B8ECD7
MLAKTIILVACIATTTALTISPRHPTWVSIYKKCFLEILKSNSAKIEPDLQICAMKEAGTMSEDGVWKVEQIIDIIPKDEPKYDDIVSAMRICAREATGKTPSETATFLPICLAGKLPCEDGRCNVTANLLVVLNATMLSSPSQ